MKTLAMMMTLAVLALPATMRAQVGMRADIDKDIPLADAIKSYNAQFPDPQPLTEDEVIASVQAIKVAHPDIKDAVYQIYQRVAKEKVLPKGMYFSHMDSMAAGNVHYDVDWKDLTLTSLPPGVKDEKIGFGFNYRIRARFISSKPADPAAVNFIILPDGAKPPTPDIR